MKKSLFKFIAITILGTAALTISVAANAADSSTNSASAKSAKSAKSAPGKISGTVSAVDTNAMTFTVGGQAYVETSASVLTRNGKPATLSDVAVGDPVQGTCTTGSDGKLEATKVRFGKGAEKSSSKSTTTAKKSSKKKKKSSASTNSVPEAPAVPDAAPTTAAPAPAPAPAPAAPAPANGPGTM